MILSLLYFLREMIKITFLSLSGGQGKSTCSLFTAKRLAQKSPLLAIDVDPQASLTELAALEAEIAKFSD